MVPETIPKNLPKNIPTNITRNRPKIDGRTHAEIWAFENMRGKPREKNNRKYMIEDHSVFPYSFSR
jgi:hypothetical protein